MLTRRQEGKKRCERKKGNTTNRRRGREIIFLNKIISFPIINISNHCSRLYHRIGIFVLFKAKPNVSLTVQPHSRMFEH